MTSGKPYERNYFSTKTCAKKKLPAEERFQTALGRSMLVQDLYYIKAQDLCEDCLGQILTLELSGPQLLGVGWGIIVSIQKIFITFSWKSTLSKFSLPSSRLQAQTVPERPRDLWTLFQALHRVHWQSDWLLFLLGMQLVSHFVTSLTCDWSASNTEASYPHTVLVPKHPCNMQSPLFYASCQVLTSEIRPSSTWLSYCDEPKILGSTALTVFFVESSQQSTFYRKEK